MEWLPHGNNGHKMYLQLSVMHFQPISSSVNQCNLFPTPYFQHVIPPFCSSNWQLKEWVSTCTYTTDVATQLLIQKESETWYIDTLSHMTITTFLFPAWLAPIHFFPTEGPIIPVCVGGRRNLATQCVELLLDWQNNKALGQSVGIS